MKFRRRANATREFAEDNFRGYYNSESVMDDLSDVEGIYLDRIDDSYRVVVDVNKISEFTARTILDFIDTINDSEDMCVRSIKDCVLAAIKAALKDEPTYKQLSTGRTRSDELSLRQHVAAVIMANNDYMMDGLTAIVDQSKIASYVD